MLGIKIAEKKGFVVMVENCVKFRSINGAVWRSINTRHRHLGRVTENSGMFVFVFLFLNKEIWVGLKPNACNSDMSSSWSESLGNPLSTTFSCLLCGPSQMCGTAIYCPRYIFELSGSLQQKLGRLGVSHFHNAPLVVYHRIYLTDRGARLHCAVNRSQWAQCVCHYGIPQ
ncbi:hypothetical protein TNCV_3457081 [Trichonephila clavipes]|nr:hypothetical protein TNCV_3457081 [Trichonephila clavipes]